MLKNTFYVAFLLCLSLENFANGASQEATAAEKTPSIESRIGNLERTVKAIDSNQLNYRIEKDLLKETYSNNYETMNMTITLILGVFGIIGFVGIRDISSTKKEYEKELSVLKGIKNEFDLKSKDFDVEKSKIDVELTALLKENQEQNKKIKFIELKEKIPNLLKNNNLPSALEFCNAALDLVPNDVICLNNKARALIRMNQTPDAIAAYREALKEKPSDISTITNMTEGLFLAGQIAEANELLTQHIAHFKSIFNGKLIDFLNMIEAFHKGEKQDLLNLAQSYITLDNLESASKRMDGWDLTEAHFFAHNLEESELKPIITIMIEYWDGRISGKTLLKIIGLPLPSQPPEE